MISVIVATSKNGAIGHGNKIPWHLPRDLKHFSAKTKGNTVLMGQKTFESILGYLGKPLPDRKTVILTLDKTFKAPEGCRVFHSVEEALTATKDENVFVSGGGQIYKLLLPYADRLLLTLIDIEIEGDTFFTFDKKDWNLVSEEFQPKDEKNKLDCTFYEYERKR